MNQPLQTSTTADTTDIELPAHRLEHFIRAIERLGAYRHAAQIEFRESPMCVTTRPVRVHKRRRHQTAAYHARVQKKWVKRFGTQSFPTAYMLDATVLGGRGQILVAHPTIAAKLRAQFAGS